VSGGGRCNVTNGCTSIAELCNAYPRGGKSLKKAFHKFSNKDTIKWFEDRGVPLVIQDDLRVFPKSGDSGSIVDCLQAEARRLGIVIKTETGVQAIRKLENKFELIFQDNGLPDQIFDKVIVTTGGSPRRSGLEWLEKMGHKIEDPVPSLFSFNMPDEALTELMGVSVDNAIVRVQGTKLVSDGPLLVTHWGMSGPAILKLSSFGARLLNEKDYHFNIQVNWAGEINNNQVYNDLLNIAHLHPKKSVANFKPFNLPGRLWNYLLIRTEIDQTRNWAELGKKGLNKLVNVLTNDIYSVKGQTTFKDEFVTCGGVSLDDVDMNTMESKVCKGLYFAGEVLDIDAVTGGFNLQAAWTTGYISGVLSSEFCLLSSVFSLALTL
jgi:predicted Rossmann fold flavoprotein